MHISSHGTERNFGFQLVICDDLTVVIAYNNKFILEYNYPNTSIDLALATVVHYGLHSQ